MLWSRLRAPLKSDDVMGRWTYMRRALALSLVSIVVLAGCAGAPGAPAPTTIPAGPTPTTPTATSTTVPAGTATAAWVNEMLTRINAERATVGAAPLRLCTRLLNAAQLHSEDQAATSRMSHTGSNGSTMSQRVEAAGYLGWTNLAENVAAGYPTVASVMDGWMGSPGHRTNLLSGSYEHVGVGRAASSSGALYWTQNFGRRGSC